MPDARSLIPSRGNPVRAPFLLVSGLSIAMLIGFNIAMPQWGIGAGNLIFFNVLWIPTAILILWIVSMIGQSTEKDRARLASGDQWAQWQLLPAEYELYARSEKNRARGTAAAFVFMGIVVCAMTEVITGDLLRSALFGGVFLVATVITLANDHAPRASATSQTLDVFIGPKGALIGGRFLTFSSTGMSLDTIDFEYGDGALPVLVFRIRIRSGRKTSYDHVRVPVPVDRIDDAKAIVTRFHEGTLLVTASSADRLPGTQVAIG